MIALAEIKQILADEDIEGLITLGAPGNEYDTEAELILNGLTKLSSNQWAQASIVSMIALVWEKSFHREKQELQVRMPAFERVAARLLHTLSIQ